MNPEAPALKLGAVAAECNAPIMPTFATATPFMRPDARVPPGRSPTPNEAASSANEAPFFFSASPKQKSDSYPLRGPLFGAYLVTGLNVHGLDVQ